jgi:hypothetical protein
MRAIIYWWEFLHFCYSDDSVFFVRLEKRLPLFLSDTSSTYRLPIWISDNTNLHSMHERPFLLSFHFNIFYASSFNFHTVNYLLFMRYSIPHLHRSFSVLQPPSITSLPCCFILSAYFYSCYHGCCCALYTSLLLFSSL